MTRKISSLLLSPAIALMSRLPFAKKFMLLGLIAFAAICITLFSLYTHLHETISKSRKELDGLTLSQPLLKSVQFLQQHRGLSTGVLNGISGLKQELAASESAVESGFASVASRLSADSRQLDSWKSIAADWKSIRTQGLQWAQDGNFAAHTRLLEALLLFQSVIADDYGLTADPDYETYYMAHVLSEELPKALEHLGQIRAYGTIMLGVKRATEQQKIQMSTLLELLNHDLVPLDIDMGKVVRYAPELKDRLFTTHDNFQRSSRHVVDEVRSEIMDGRFSMRPEEFFVSATVAIDNGYAQIYQTMLPTTRELIHARIRDAEKTLYLTAGIALLLLLLVAYFMAAIYATTMGSIRQLSQTVLGFVRGDMHDRVRLETRDELSRIGDSFNEMADEIAALTDAREETLEILQKIADRVPGVVYQYRLHPDGSSCFPFASEALREIYRVNPEEVREDASGVFAVIHPDDLDGVAASIQSSARDLTHWSHEYRVKFADGAVRWLSGTAMPEREVDGSTLWHGFITDITEHKQAGEALHRSETKLRTLYESTSDAVMLLDEKGFFDCNRAALALFGCATREELCSRHPADLSPPIQPCGTDSMTLANQQIATAMKQGNHQFEWVHKRTDSGQDFSADVLLNRMELDGKMILQATVRNITIRKLAEEKLQKTQSSLIAAQQLARIGSWEWDVRNNAATWSDETYRLFEIDKNDLREHRKNFLNMIAPEDRSKVDQALSDALDGVRKYDVEYKICLAGGRKIIIHALAEVIRDMEGKAVTMHGTVQDITVRKNHEAQIERLSSTYRLLSRINEAIVRTGGKGELFAAICEAAVDSGLFRLAWIGMLDAERDRVMPVAYAGVEEGYTDKVNIRLTDERTGNGPIGRTIRTGEFFICQDIENNPSMTPWRDDTIRRGYFSSAAFPVHEAGAVVGTINVYAGEANFFTPDIIQLMLELAADMSFALDVFAGKQRRECAEEEIRQLNIELEHRVQDRTKQLEDANKELEAFSYSVSHDLRAPLRSIDGFSRVLSKKYYDQLDATGRDWLERICNASQHMGRLIDDMLQLSLVARGTLKREQVDLSRIAEAVADGLRKINPERQVRFVAQQGLSAQADPGLLRIVMDNLLGNAWKFTSKKPDIEIEFGTRDIDGGNTFFVRDNGDGFNTEYAYKLFGAFQRLHTAHEFEGTGIGLATVQRIIHRHNGKVWAEAIEGQGATFYFTLPQRERGGGGLAEHDEVK